MKKSIFWLVVLLFMLTTYNPKLNSISKFNLNIKKIIIQNNSIVSSEEIKKKLDFLNNTNLFLLNTKDISKNITEISFIESFTLKKVYPSTIKINIVEKKPIAIIHEKKIVNYISDKGELIKFRHLDMYKDLPTIFGNHTTFYSLYKDLQNLEFPIEEISSFFYFESGRWDLLMYNNKVIKLPNKDYVLSIKKFMDLKNNTNIQKYQIFDFRIKDQLILN
tara:strand:- start:707 stop:1366 length:660 start_codon:yes stop_codon:yes gene_type:complete